MQGNNNGIYNTQSLDHHESIMLSIAYKKSMSLSKYSSEDDIQEVLDILKEMQKRILFHLDITMHLFKIAEKSMRVKIFNQEKDIYKNSVLLEYLLKHCNDIIIDEIFTSLPFLDEKSTLTDLKILSIITEMKAINYPNSKTAVILQSLYNSAFHEETKALIDSTRETIKNSQQKVATYIGLISRQNQVEHLSVNTNNNQQNI